MTDLDDALRRLGGPQRDLAPQAGQAARAAGLVARRRRRKATAVGSVGALSLAAAVSVGASLTSAGTVSLEQREGVARQPTGLASPRASTTPTPAASSTPGEASTGTAPTSGPALIRSSETPPSARLGPGPERAPEPQLKPESERGGPGQTSRRPPVTRSSERLSAVCTRENSGIGGGTELPAPADWCLVAEVKDDGNAQALSALVCRNNSGPSDLTFRTRKEADFAVVRAEDGKELWRWSTGQQFPDAPHNYRLAEGDCLRWTVRWDGTTDQGDAPTPDTELTLVVDIDAAELQGKTADARFTAR